MAVAIAGTTSGSGTSVVTLTSWTPLADELVLLFIALRDETLVLSSTGPLGNNLTWVHVLSVVNDDDECGLRVYRAMGDNPVTGTITFAVEGNSFPIVGVAVRISGVDTSGANGSGAVEALEYDDGPVGSNDDVKVDVETLSFGALVLAAATHRNTTFTTPAGETTVSINNSLGTGVERITLSVWTQATTNPAIVTVGADNDISAVTDWIIIGFSIKPLTAQSGAVVRRQRAHLMYRERRVKFTSSSGDVIMTASVYEDPVSSSYSGNAIEGVEVRNSIRLIGRFDPRGLIGQGDYVYITKDQFFILISVKIYGSWQTEFIGIREVTARDAVPNVIKPINLAAATAETSIWQPALGKRFRLMDLELRQGAATQTILTFRDGLAGKIVLYGAPASQSDVFAPRIQSTGILSSAVDNPLTVERSQATTLTGYLAGFEE